MYTKKVVMLCMIILALFVAPLIVPKASAQSFGVSVTPPTQTVGIGEQVTANVTITDMPAPGLYSFQLEVLYNNTLLNATSAQVPSDGFMKPATAGNLFIVLQTFNQTTGLISLAATLLGDEAGKTGTGTLGTMAFTGLAVGNATLEVQNVILVVDTNPVDPTTYTIEDGLIEVIPEFSLIAMMAAFAAMSFAAVKMKKKLN